MKGNAMFSFRLQRTEIAVLGLIAIVAAIWGVWLVKTPGIFLF